MALRQIGQESFRFGARAVRPTSLDALLTLIDWEPAGRTLTGLYAPAMGEKAWPPFSMFKALLIASWYDLSDVMLAEALADRASFRRFCGFAREEDPPGRTAFVRFRRLLLAQDLDKSLFEAIARDLEAKGAAVRKGALIDAAVIGPASKGDHEAAWAKHKSRAPMHGYKAHIAAGKDTGIIREVETAPANEADVNIAPSIIPDDPGEVYGGKAYDALSAGAAIEAKGGTAKLLRKGHRWLKAEALKEHNRPLKPIRPRIEKIFGTWKRSYHFRAMRWMGLAKARLQVRLAAIAYNMKRSLRLQTA